MGHTKIFKDIWTTGEIKDTYDLDLNWPNSKQVKTTKNPAPEQKDKTNESIDEQSNQENNKIYWIIGGLVLVSLAGLIAFSLRKK